MHQQNPYECYVRMTNKEYNDFAVAPKMELLSLYEVDLSLDSNNEIFLLIFFWFQLPIETFVWKLKEIFLFQYCPLSIKKNSRKFSMYATRVGIRRYTTWRAHDLTLIFYSVINTTESFSPEKWSI